MPTGKCVPYLRVKSARASVDYFHRCLGFHQQWEHRDGDGLPLSISVARGNLQFFLSENTGDGNFGICLYCHVTNVDLLHAEYLRTGALSLSSVYEMPWGRNFSVRDLDGNEIRFGTPSKPDLSMAA